MIACLQLLQTRNQPKENEVPRKPPTPKAVISRKPVSLGDIGDTKYVLAYYEWFKYEWRIIHIVFYGADDSPILKSAALQYGDGKPLVDLRDWFVTSGRYDRGRKPGRMLLKWTWEWGVSLIRYVNSTPAGLSTEISEKDLSPVWHSLIHQGVSIRYHLADVISRTFSLRTLPYTWKVIPKL